MLLSFFKKKSQLSISKKIPFGISFWVTIITLIFVLNSLFANKEEIFDIEISYIMIKYFLISLLLTIISLYVNAFAWASICKSFKIKADYNFLVSLHIQTNFRKYLPGNIWHFVGRIKGLQGVAETSIALSAVFVEPIFMLCAALLFVPIYNFSFNSIIFFLPIFLIHPKVSYKIINSIKKSKLPSIAKKLPGFKYKTQESEWKIINTKFPFKQRSN